MQFHVEFKSTDQKMNVQFKGLQIVGNGSGGTDIPIYDGKYEVKPLAGKGTTLQTAQKFLEKNVFISQIPFSETSNASGGETAYIGMEVEFYGD